MTVLVESLVVVTVLVVVFSVTMGSFVVSVVSSCACAAVAKNNIVKAANIFLNMVFALGW